MRYWSTSSSTAQLTVAKNVVEAPAFRESSLIKEAEEGVSKDDELTDADTGSAKRDAGTTTKKGCAEEG